MNALEALRQKLKKGNLSVIPATQKLILSKERTSLFFDRTVLPAFVKIADELKGFPVRTFTRKYAFIARILGNDKDSSFNFRIEIDNKSSTLEISFNYRDDIITNYYRAAEPDYHIDGAVTYRCETITLNEYETVTEDRIIEAFTKFYLTRKEIAVKINEEKRTAMALKMAQAVEEDKILQAAERKMEIGFRLNYRKSLKKKECLK